MRALLVLCLVSSTAAADPATDDAPFAFVASHIGVGTPVGAVGIEGGVGLSWFRISAGTGLGFLGIQKMIGVRLVYPGDGRRFFVGGGLSRGPGVNELGVSLGEGGDEPAGRVDHGKRTVWTNLDVGFEWLMNRLEVRLYAGFSTVLKTDCVIVVDGMGRACDAEHYDRLSEWSPYFGVSIGRRID